LTDAHEEGGDPACWLHFFEDEPEDVDPRPDRPPAGTVEGPAPDEADEG